jgi:2-polyprenyl-3-methyl-5-hydroxy-6-metoxy-1,4-benzoquinol methylase
MSDQLPTRLASLDEVDAVFERARQCTDPAAFTSLLLEYYYDAGDDLAGDPFSAEYVDQVIRLHGRLTEGGRYDPRTNELSPNLPELAEIVRHPSPYRHGGTETLGDFFIAFGFVLQQLALPAGASLIEYGPGSGQLALACARNGCDVTVVDIEPKYVEAIETQAARLDVPIHAVVGEFGDVPETGRRYDAVLFFESFHHALRHNELMHRLHDVVADGGRVVLAGEPIIAPGNLWEPAYPATWGPRTDLLSMWSMRVEGWLELGFREAYLIEAAERAGWAVEKRDCALSFRGNTWILTPSGEPRRESQWRGRLARVLRGG